MSRARYNIYLHKDTLSKNKEKRRIASFDIKLGIRLARDKINAYDVLSARVSRTWFVVIYQAPHDSSGRLQNRRRPSEPPHYTIFGFSRIDDVSNVERYIEHWFIHVYVDTKGTVTGVRFDESTGVRRRLNARDMNFLCGPFSV